MSAKAVKEEADGKKKWKGTLWTMCNCKNPTPGCGGAYYGRDEDVSE